MRISQRVGAKDFKNSKCNRLDGDDAAELHLLPVGDAVTEPATSAADSPVTSHPHREEGDICED